MSGWRESWAETRLRQGVMKYTQSRVAGRFMVRLIERVRVREEEPAFYMVRLELNANRAKGERRYKVVFSTHNMKEALDVFNNDAVVFDWED